MANISGLVGALGARLGPMAVVVLIVTALPLLLATAAAVMVAVMAALAPADRQRHLLAVFNGLVLLVAVLRPGGGAAVMESNVR